MTNPRKALCSCSRRLVICVGKHDVSKPEEDDGGLSDSYMFVRRGSGAALTNPGPEVALLLVTGRLVALVNLRERT